MVPKLKVFYTEGVVTKLFTCQIQSGKELHTIAPVDTVISHAKAYCIKLIQKSLAYETLCCNHGNSYTIYYACTSSSVEHVAGYVGGVLGVLIVGNTK